MNATVTSSYLFLNTTQNISNVVDDEHLLGKSFQVCQ